MKQAVEVIAVLAVGFGIAGKNDKYA